MFTPRVISRTAVRKAAISAAFGTAVHIVDFQNAGGDAGKSAGDAVI